MRSRYFLALAGLTLASAFALPGCGGASSESADAVAGAAAASGGEEGALRTALADPVWVRCAAEGANCSFTGTQDVRYGLNGAYVYKKVAGGVACTNEAFGSDPLPGADKVCDRAAAPEPVPAPVVTWTRCALEDGRCTFSGTKEVRYGAQVPGQSFMRFSYRIAPGGIDCNNNVFGDPVPGADKACDVKSVATAPTPPVPGAKTPFGQNAADYVLTFSEEFDASTYDKAKWLDRFTWYETKPDPDTTPNWAVGNGTLKMFPAPGTPLDRDYRHFTTDTKFEQTYGYFEMEAKLPRGNGVWPALWLYNHKSPNAAVRPEIDIMEAYPGGGTDYGWGSVDRRPTSFGTTVHRGDGDTVGMRKHDTGIDLSAGFHKYAVKWQPNRITFYLDGKEIFSVNESMNQPMFLLLSLQMCGQAQSGWCPPAAPDMVVYGQGNSFEVNYVRAWQFKQ